MFDTYLFDLDGTLTDSGEGIMNAVRYSLAQSGDRDPGEEVLRRFIGPPLWESFERFLGFSEEKAQRAVELYRVYYKDRGLFENRVYDGIEDMLKGLKNAGKQLAVATCKPEPFSVRILEHFGLSRYFDNITGSLLDGTRREKREVIAEAVRRCGADPEKALMVGDRKHDIIGARENGIGCIGVLWGYGSREEFLEYGASGIISDPGELLNGVR